MNQCSTDGEKDCCKFEACHSLSFGVYDLGSDFLRREKKAMFDFLILLSFGFVFST